MIKMSIALAGLAAVLAFSAPGEAVAGDYAYCLQGRQWGYPGNCQFSSYNQCLATASGTDSYCGVNPRAAYALQPEEYVRRRHRR